MIAFCKLINLNSLKRKKVPARDSIQAEKSQRSLKKKKGPTEKSDKIGQRLRVSRGLRGVDQHLPSKLTASIQVRIAHASSTPRPMPSPTHRNQNCTGLKTNTRQCSNLTGEGIWKEGST
jgi:hypothetical protein